MNKAEFVAKFAEKAKESKNRSADLVDAFLNTVEKSLLKGETVQFIGWGSFEVKKTAARKGRNPNTGAEIKIPAKSVVRFKAGKGLADKVKGKK
jgi:DNA-binding protein HU-beta